MEDQGSLPLLELVGGPWTCGSDVTGVRGVGHGRADGPTRAQRLRSHHQHQHAKVQDNVRHKMATRGSCDDTQLTPSSSSPTTAPLRWRLLETNHATGTILALTTYRQGVEDGPQWELHTDGADKMQGQCDFGWAWRVVVQFPLWL